MSVVDCPNCVRLQAELQATRAALTTGKYRTEQERVEARRRSWREYAARKRREQGAKPQVVYATEQERLEARRASQRRYQRRRRDRNVLLRERYAGKPFHLWWLERYSVAELHVLVQGLIPFDIPDNERIAA